MSPEDSLFDEPKSEAPEDTDGKPGESSGNGGISQDAIEELISSQLDPIQTQLEASNLELAAQKETNRALEARLNSSPTDEPAAPTQDEFVDKFTNDMPGTVNELVAKGVETQIQPIIDYLKRQNSSDHDSLVSQHQARIDSEYGEGTWHKEYEPVFKSRMDELSRENLSSLSDPSVINREVRGITGLKINELFERKSEFTSSQNTEREKEEQRLMDKFRFNTQGMTGGTHAVPMNTSKEHTDAEKDYLASCKISGHTPDMQKIRESAARDGTLKSYLAAHPQSPGAKA